MNLQEANEIIGSLSSPSKMPGFAWGIPTKYCQRGGILQGVVGSVCGFCYANAGWYPMDHVQDALERRFAGTKHQRWIEAMIVVLSSEQLRTSKYFRWFDSGDLQSVEMFVSICVVAHATPWLKHWLPTREFQFVQEAVELLPHVVPRNLCVRISSDMIDGRPVSFWPTTSNVIRFSESIGWECPATRQDYRCGDCRACWNRDIENVSLHYHSQKEADGQYFFALGNVGIKKMEAIL